MYIVLFEIPVHISLMIHYYVLLIFESLDLCILLYLKVHTYMRIVLNSITTTKQLQQTILQSLVPIINIYMIVFEFQNRINLRMCTRMKQKVQGVSTSQHE